MNYKATKNVLRFEINEMEVKTKKLPHIFVSGGGAKCRRVIHTVEQTCVKRK
jgi:hypothetical protein